MKFKWPWTKKNELIAKLQEENGKLKNVVEGKFDLRWVDYRKGQPLDFAWRCPEFVVSLSGQFDQWFKEIGADNYIYQELSFGNDQESIDLYKKGLNETRLEVDIRHYSITVQKRSGKTPIQHRDEARADAEKYRKLSHEEADLKHQAWKERDEANAKAERAMKEMFSLAEDYDRLKEAFDKLQATKVENVKYAEVFEETPTQADIEAAYQSLSQDELYQHRAALVTALSSRGERVPPEWARSIAVRELGQLHDLLREKDERIALLRTIEDKYDIAATTARNVLTAGGVPDVEGEAPNHRALNVAERIQWLLDLSNRVTADLLATINKRADERDDYKEQLNRVTAELQALLKNLPDRAAHEIFIDVICRKGWKAQWNEWGNEPLAESIKNSFVNEIRKVIKAIFEECSAGDKNTPSSKKPT